MKKIIYSVAVITVAAVCFIVLKSSSNGAPGNYTNSPVSQVNCSACHGGGNFNPNQGLELEGLPANGYDAGETYQLTLKITSPTNSNGFQISCLDGNNSNGGNFTSASGSRTSGTAGNELSLTHSVPSSNGEWAFEWTAPSNNAGELTFYAVGNATQGGGTRPGDMVYGQTFSLEPSQATFVKEHEKELFKLYPNPVRNAFHVEHLYRGKLPFTIFNIAGKVVEQGVLNSANTQIRAGDLQPGIYFFQAAGNVSKFVKL